MNRSTLFAFALTTFLVATSANSQKDVAIVEAAVKALGIEAHLKMMAEEGNKNAPYLIDKETQYSSAGAGEKRLTTQWVFLKRKKSEINVNILKQSMAEQGLARLCTNPVSRMLINRYDATLSHTYSDKDGVFLFSFNGNRAECKAY